MDQLELILELATTNYKRSKTILWLQVVVVVLLLVNLGLNLVVQHEIRKANQNINAVINACRPRA